MSSASDDAALAAIARALAEALSARARDRTVACNMRVAELQTELCAAWRKEQEERFAALALDNDDD